MLYGDEYYIISDESDLFNTGGKAKAITSLLNDNISNMSKINMMALYGKWGSGKTSVMKHIEDNVKNYYSPIFFEAWKYENDENLMLSLMELMIIEYKKEIKENKLIEGLQKTTYTLLTFTKNILLSSQVSFLGGALSFNLEAAATKTISEANNKYEYKSYYKAIEDFREKFNEVVATYCKETKKSLLIIVDDLDRCEPQNVLNLLASIKHFFTHSKVTYLCGIDKEAVENAIKIKYGNVINGDDYLDKIFDMSFRMPEPQLDGIVRDFFKTLREENSDCPEGVEQLLIDFLNKIKFTNPRKVKKIFNKYYYMNKLNFNGTDEECALILRNTSNACCIVLNIIIIIFNEFYTELVNELLDYNHKLDEICNIIDMSSITTDKNSNIDKIEYIKICKQRLFEASLKVRIVGDVISNPINDLTKILIWLTPLDINSSIKTIPYAYGENIRNLLDKSQTYIDNIRSKQSKNYILIELQQFIVDNINKFTGDFEYPIYNMLKMINTFS